MKRLFKVMALCFEHSRSGGIVTLLGITLAVLGLPQGSLAWTKEGNVYTTDGSYSDVNSAIQDATPGDIVTLPAGTFGSGQGWTSTLTIQKRITLKGAGMTSTTIASTAFTVILLNSTNASGIRITGIRFNGSSNIFALIAAPVINFRFDHCYFKYDSSGGIAVRVAYFDKTVPIQGLIDNCRIDYGRIYLENYPDETGYWDFAVWSNDTDLGGVTAIYVEDCDFYCFKDGPRPWHAMDGNMGAGYVSRYNNMYGLYHEFHGPESNGGEGNRGGRKFEAYRNYMYSDYFEEVYRNQWEPFYMRSGTGVIFQNEFQGYSMDRIRFSSYRWTVPQGNCGICDGGNLLDDNDDSTGWLCLDQPGAGKDESTRTEGNPSPYQEHQPIYIWGNTTQGSPNNTVTTANLTNWVFNDHFQSDRDIFIEGYDTVGMSVGVLALRPSECTVGQGYWATDQGNWNQMPGEEQGVLYKCTAPNTWTLYYMPYTYPHPLRNETLGIYENKSGKMRSVPTSAFSVVPSPFTTFTTVPGYENSQFIVYDITGKIAGVYRGDRIGEGLSAGVYFVMNKTKSTKRGNGGCSACSRRMYMIESTKTVRIIKVR